MCRRATTGSSFATTNGGRAGELVPTGDYWIELRDHERRRRRLSNFTQADLTEDFGRRVLRLVTTKLAGGQPDADLQGWLDGLPNATRERLGRIGLLDAAAMAATKPLAGHLDDWKTSLRDKGNTPGHAELASGRARRVFDACGFTTFGEIKAAEVQSRLAALREPRAKPDGTTAPGISAQTSNFYLQAVNQFCRFMVKNRRASAHPLACLDGLNVRTDRRHDRRVFSLDELRILLDVTADGRGELSPTTRFGMSGPERSLVYRLAVETGLRAAELRSLTRASFVLDGDEPTVTIAAASAKNRREDTLPLRPDTAAKLAAHLAGKMPTAHAFNVPPSYDTADMIRADLADARRAWVAEAETAQERERGEKSDFLWPTGTRRGL